VIQPWLAEILVCPRCRGKLRAQPDGGAFVCAACRVLYPVEDGIPQMLPESGRPLDGESGEGSDR
jgi:uncharacterized protein YbaR (Trm112 family)